MSQDLTIAFLAGLGGMIGWGLADFFAKKTIDDIGDTVSLVWAHIFGTIGLLVVAFYLYIHNGSSIAYPTSLFTWGGLIFFGILQAVVYLLVYIGFGKGQVAVLNPVFASFTGLTAILSILLFKEPVNSSLIAILLIIFVGVLLLSTDFNALKINKLAFFSVPGSKEVLVATFFAAFWTLFWDRFVSGNNWIYFALHMYVFMTLSLLIYARIKSINLNFNKPAAWKFLVLIGLFEVFAYLSISWGYSSTTHTSIIALISGAFSLPVIILARIFLREKVTRIQTLGGVVVIAGVVLLAII